LRIDFFPVVADPVEEELEGDILEEHWGLDMGEKPTTCKLDSWGKIKVAYLLPVAAFLYPALQKDGESRHLR
jgi:hypothetical protein